MLPLGPLLEVGSKILDRVLPDPEAAAKAKAELAKLHQDGELAKLANDVIRRCSDAVLGEDLCRSIPELVPSHPASPAHRKTGTDRKILCDREIGEYADILMDEAQAGRATHHRVHVVRRVLVVADNDVPASIGADHTGEHLDQRRFTTEIGRAHV